MFGRFLSKSIYGCTNPVCSRIGQQFANRASQAVQKVNLMACCVHRVERDGHRRSPITLEDQPKK
jgi:hypothetical protein